MTDILAKWHMWITINKPFVIVPRGTSVLRCILFSTFLGCYGEEKSKSTISFDSSSDTPGKIHEVSLSTVQSDDFSHDSDDSLEQHVAFTIHSFLAVGWTSAGENGSNTPPSNQPPPVVNDGPSTIQPEMLISLMAPAACSRYFVGRHHLLGGRFLPSDLVKKYDLDRLPPFPGLDVVVDLKAAPPFTNSSSDNDATARNRKDAADDGFPSSLVNAKEQKGKTANED